MLGLLSACRLPELMGSQRHVLYCPSEGFTCCQNHRLWHFFVCRSPDLSGVARLLRSFLHSSGKTIHFGPKPLQEGPTPFLLHMVHYTCKRSCRCAFLRCFLSEQILSRLYSGFCCSMHICVSDISTYQEQTDPHYSHMRA